MILRAFNIESEIRKASENIREFVISNERKDAHNTIIKMDGWQIDDFNRNGTFFYMHKTGGEVMNPDYALGPAKAIKEKNELIGVATFEPLDINPLSDKILKKIDFGTIKATSVGFVPERGHFGSERDNEDPTAYYFDQHILKEFSIVHIPSNGDALKREFEAIEAFLTKEIETVKSNGIKSDFKRNHSTRKIQYLYNLGLSRRLFD